MKKKTKDLDLQEDTSRSRVISHLIDHNSH